MAVRGAAVLARIAEPLKGPSTRVRICGSPEVGHDQDALVDDSLHELAPSFLSLRVSEVLVAPLLVSFPVLATCSPLAIVIAEVSDE